MVESTFVLIDNSSYVRNGDYPTTRYDAMLATLELVFNSKINSNPENSVGLLSYSGDSTQILSSLTTDYGKVLKGLHEVKIGGNNNFNNGLLTASLALKHRLNKVGQQRIIVFVALPLINPDLSIAPRLKKNQISVDIINFGETSLNTTFLENFISASNDTSHLVTVPPGPNSLFQAVATSPILSDGVSDGVTPSFFDDGMDPDLALALRLSLEEEKSRQERELKEKELKEVKLDNVEEKEGDTQEDVVMKD